MVERADLIGSPGSLIVGPVSFVGSRGSLIGASMGFVGLVRGLVELRAD